VRPAPAAAGDSHWCHGFCQRENKQNNIITLHRTTSAKTRATATLRQRHIPPNVVRNLNTLKYLEMKTTIKVLIILLLCSCQNHSTTINKPEKSHPDLFIPEKSTTIQLNEIQDYLQLNHSQLLGVMTSEDKTIVLLLGEKNDSTYRETNLYVYPKGPIHFSDSLISQKYSLPGNAYDIFDSLVYQARVFYGNCMKEFPFSIIWIQKEKHENQKWLSNVFVLTPDDPNRLTYSLVNDDTILKEILENLKKGDCKEIPGMDIYLEP
jgi:hypothetical protein